MSDTTFESIYSYIEEATGIRVNPSHKVYLDNWIQSNLDQFKYTEEQYLALVQRDEMERSALIDEAAINETYFFREEIHFSYLEDMVFPLYAGGSMHIWSAASSTGEEALSLYALGKKCGVTVQVTASDIDRNALAVLRKGEYGNHSFRRNENHYMHLLQELGAFTDGEEKKLIVSDEIKSHITAVTYNLITDTVLPVADESVDVIFLRNVFIYFSSQNQLQVLQKVSRALKPGGLLFLSINEIASIECPDSLPLMKDHFQSVYFMRKVDPAQKRSLAATRRRSMEQSTAVRIQPDNQVAELEELPAGIVAAKKRLETISDSSTVQSVEELWVDVQQHIKDRQFQEARTAVTAFRFKATQLEFRHYYLGMIALSENSLQDAHDSFFRSAVANPRFWPAQFQLGMTCQRMQNAKGAEDALQRCVNLLKNPELFESTQYAFLLENFSPAYFLNLCNSLLRK